MSRAVVVRHVNVAWFRCNQIQSHHGDPESPLKVREPLRVFVVKPDWVTDKPRWNPSVAANQ